jgi:hypothetical protein
MLQVTLYTSLKLRGRTTELPPSDFNRLVTRFTRHTLQVKWFRFEIEVRITSWTVASDSNTESGVTDHLFALVGDVGARRNPHQTVLCTVKEILSQPVVSGWDLIPVARTWVLKSDESKALYIMV